MPARRDQDKTPATETPLAAVDPTMPPRSVAHEDVENVPREDAATEDAFVLETATSDIHSGNAEIAETVPLLTPPAPSRRGVRKVDNRRPAASVPRTIAELERQEAGLPPESGSDGNADIADETTGANDDAPSESEDDAPVEDVKEEEARPILLVPLRSVGYTTAAMWLLAAFVPQVVLIMAQRIGIATGTSAAVFYTVLGIGAALALALLLRAWRGVFGTAPDDLNWRTIPVALARQIQTTPNGPMRRNRWRTASLSALFGAVFMVAIYVASAVSHPTAINFLSLLGFFVTLFAKTITAAAFVGFLQRALNARFPKPRAALLSGAAYGVANAVLLAAVFAAPIQTASGITLSALQVAEDLALSTTVAFFIYIGIAWFRMKANSVWAAVAFLLTLWILFLPLGISL